MVNTKSNVLSFQLTNCDVAVNKTASLILSKSKLIVKFKFDLPTACAMQWSVQVVFNFTFLFFCKFSIDYVKLEDYVMYNFEKELESMNERIRTLCNDVSCFGEKLKVKFEENNLSNLEEKFNVKIGETILWKGIEAKIVTIAKDYVSVSLKVEKDVYSKVIHRVEHSQIKKTN